MPRLSKLSRSIQGRSAIVTGAASGMGRATAHLFADEGAKVAVTDVEKGAVETVVDEIRAAGGEAAGWVLDVTDRESVPRVFAEVAEAFGGIDILINNAGISEPVAIDDENYDAVWSKILGVLLTAHTSTVRAALPWLRKSDSARIVNISSTEGHGATRTGSPYTAAKHGVIGLTRSLAVELGRDQITVNCVCPGPINTPLTSDIEDAKKAIFARRRTALERYGEPEEVAHGTLNFVLPASRYMTGAVLIIDGGLLIRNA